MINVKTLVVYFSRSGATRTVAKAIAVAVGGTLDEITERRTRNGILGYFRSARQARGNTLVPIEPMRENAADFDLVIIGTPVWAWSVSAPVRAYLAQNAGKFQNVAFFCTMGGSGADRVFGQMAAIAGKGPLATCAVPQNIVDGGGFADRVRDFEKILKERLS